MEINESFWNQIKDKLESRNTDNKLLETWLNPVTYVDTKGTSEVPRLILGVPNQLSRYFVIENLMDKIYAEISSELGGPFEVDLILKGGQQPVQQELIENQPSYSENHFPNSHGVATGKVISQDKRKDVLNPEYSFKTFVVGRNTEFAHAASYNVAQNPGAEGYNPLFICGPVGMGKTHLLQAVGNEIRSRHGNLRIVYTSAESFLNECVSAIRRQEMDKFRARYRESADILLVDDVQYIGKGQATQEEFFHMINSFLEQKKQVILASDRMPKDILNIEDRTRSRLEWGLIADISMPDLETRVAILRYKAEKFTVSLNEEVITYLARISKRSIRELEGNLKKAKMFSELQGISIDINLAKRVLATHETQTTISAEDIQKLVADHFTVKISDLKSTSRSKQNVIPRQISMYLIKKHLDRSLVDIGRAFGGRDHTTVINAIDRVEKLQASDLDIKNQIDELVTRIHNITGL